MPVFNLTAGDYEGNPKQVNHSNEANGGYETGDIFVNINEKGFKQMNVGDTYDVLGMRTWELIDNVTNNYFLEPDFSTRTVSPATMWCASTPTPHPLIPGTR